MKFRLELERTEPVKIQNKTKNCLKKHQWLCFDKIKIKKLVKKSMIQLCFNFLSILGFGYFYVISVSFLAWVYFACRHLVMSLSYPFYSFSSFWLIVCDSRKSKIPIFQSYLLKNSSRHSKSVAHHSLYKICIKNTFLTSQQLHAPLHSICCHLKHHTRKHFIHKWMLDSFNHPHKHNVALIYVCEWQTLNYQM